MEEAYILLATAALENIGGNGTVKALSLGIAFLVVKPLHIVQVVTLARTVWDCIGGNSGSTDAEIHSGIDHAEDIGTLLGAEVIV